RQSDNTPAAGLCCVTAPETDSYPRSCISLACCKFLCAHYETPWLSPGDIYFLSVCIFNSLNSLLCGGGPPGEQYTCKVLAIVSSGTTRVTNPLSMAALGMPNTTHDSSLCAIVSPPAARTAPTPSAPSSPMPVIRMAMEVGPNSCATDRNNRSTEGR